MNCIYGRPLQVPTWLAMREMLYAILVSRQLRERFAVRSASGSWTGFPRGHEHGRSHKSTPSVEALQHRAFPGDSVPTQARSVSPREWRAAFECLE